MEKELLIQDSSIKHAIDTNPNVCTYTISVRNALVDAIRPSFINNEEIGKWMSVHIEALLTEMAARQKNRANTALLTQRLRGIAAHAPKDFDYKKELETRF